MRFEQFRKGLFIVFEGGEGAGKTSQVEETQYYLKELGFDVVRTREPGGSVGAEEIRQLLVTGEPDRWSAITEMCLFNAARRDHLEKVIWPALREGKIVLCDRYVGSTHALQHDLTAQQIFNMHMDICDGFMPNIQIYLDIDPEIGLKRALDRDPNASQRFEAKGLDYHKEVRKRYQVQSAEYERRRFNTRVYTINANRSLHVVKLDVLDAIRLELHRKGWCDV